MSAFNRSSDAITPPMCGPAHNAGFQWSHKKWLSVYGVGAEEIPTLLYHNS